MKIEDLGLSAKAYHVLKEAQIDTVEQLGEVLSNPFVKIGSIGSSVFNEIQEKLAAHPLTNGERIRAMSDEELAELLNRVQQPCNFCQLAFWEGACTETLCDDAMMNWLKQPAKEDAPYEQRTYPPHL